LPVHLKPERPMLLDARGVEETVELGVAVERAVGGVAVADRVAVKEDVEEVRRVGEVHRPAAEEHLRGAGLAGFGEENRERDLLEVHANADRGQIALDELAVLSADVTG